MTPEDKDTRLTILPDIQNTTFIIVEALRERDDDIRVKYNYVFQK